MRKIVELEHYTLVPSDSDPHAWKVFKKDGSPFHIGKYLIDEFNAGKMPNKK